MPSDEKVERHLNDVYAALGLKWGDDPFARIKELTELEKRVAERLVQVFQAIQTAGGCDGCEEGEDVSVTEDDPTDLYHMDGEDSHECENMVLHEIHRRGLLNPTALKRCPEGHDWYGDGCPECVSEPSDAEGG